MAAHLGGDVNMVAVVDAILSEEVRRKQREMFVLSFRPDHGHQMPDDSQARKRIGIWRLPS